MGVGFWLDDPPSVGGSLSFEDRATRMKTTMKKFFRMAALSLGMAALIAASGSSANATFSYSTTVSIDPPGGSSATTPGGVTIAPATPITIGGVTETGFSARFGNTIVSLYGTARTGFFVPGTNTLDLADVAAISTTSTPPGDSFTVGYTILLNLTNDGPPPSTLPLTIKGRLTVSGASTGSGTITNFIFPPSSGTVNIGGVSFSGGVDSYSPPTINGAFGSIGGTVTAAVPEPGSIALLGCGLAGAFGLFRRRKAKLTA